MTVAVNDLPESCDLAWTDDWDDEHRVIWSTSFFEGERAQADVRVIAYLHSDGTLATDVDAPRVSVNDNFALTATRARQFATALICAADLADRWAGK